MIEFQDVFFAYEKQRVLEKTTFSIQENEFVGIIGPNGGGKTTLLHLLMGFLKPQIGTIKIHGKNPRAQRSLIGYVPQKKFFDVSFPISTLDVVLMGALSTLNAWGRYPLAIKEKAANLLAQFDLIDYLDTPFGELSGGQMQKTLIARALLCDPKLLILDEPTASVDPYGEENINQFLLSLKSKLTMIIVTHEVPGILPDVDKILCVNRKTNFISKEKVCSHVAMGLYHEQEKGS